MVRFAHPAQQIVLQDYIDAVADARQGRGAERDEILQHFLPTGPSRRSWTPVRRSRRRVHRRGDVVAEVGDFQRFDTPRQLMAYLELARRAFQRTSVQRGGITKAGSGLARRAWLQYEGAWSYRMQARVSRTCLARLEALPKAVRDIAGRATGHCASVTAMLIATGKAKVVVITGIAREEVVRF